MKQVDDNGDGEISFEEFQQMMKVNIDWRPKHQWNAKGWEEVLQSLHEVTFFSTFIFLKYIKRP